MTTARLADHLASLCEELSASGMPVLSAAGTALSARLKGPLLVALAGRMKAGKSTLLNALVGEHVAPTDTSECTRFVTWYHDGPNYLATLVGEGGTRMPLRFTREGGKATIDVPDAVPDVSEIVVTLPSRRLRRIRLADTPGFDSSDPLLGVRTRRLIEHAGAGQPPRVDAVVYLLRMAHSADAGFLEVFDANGIPGSPIAAVGVLSRADELLDASLTAMDDAADLAGVIARPDVLGGVLGAVVPVSGLLAETAVTLTEPEFAWLKSIAAMDRGARNASLVSIDRFCTTGTDVVPIEAREELARRFGLFGLRWAIDQIATGKSPTSATFARDLAEVSGLRALRQTLEVRFESRAERLVCRSVLTALRALLPNLSSTESSAARALDAELERIETRAHELAELRLLEAVLSGELILPPQQRDEVERLVDDTGVAQRLGLAESSGRAGLMTEAANRAMAWRARSQEPLAPPSERAFYEIAARSYEGIFAELSSS